MRDRTVPPPVPGYLEDGHSCPSEACEKYAGRDCPASRVKVNVPPPE